MDRLFLASNSLCCQPFNKFQWSFCLLNCQWIEQLNWKQRLSWERWQQQINGSQRREKQMRDWALFSPAVYLKVYLLFERNVKSSKICMLIKRIVTVSLQCLSAAPDPSSSLCFEDQSTSCVNRQTDREINLDEEQTNVARVKVSALRSWNWWLLLLLKGHETFARRRFAVKCA